LPLKVTLLSHKLVVAEVKAEVPIPAPVQQVPPAVKAAKAGCSSTLEAYKGYTHILSIL
jgi:hypothetical protein